MKGSQGLLLPATLLLAALADVRAASPAVLVTDPSMTRMVALSERGSKCTQSTDRSYIRRLVLESPRHMVKETSDSDMDALLDACQDRDGGRRAGFIYPGTKWCGPGNVALGYHDLGPLEAEDRCCREHDHCPAQLGPGECSRALCNTSPFTRSHCDCDARFRRCLQTVNSDAANTLGAVFFNVVQVTCFKEERPCPQSEDPCLSQFVAMPMYTESRNRDFRRLGRLLLSIVTKVVRFLKGREIDTKPCSQWTFRPSGRYTPLPPIF